MNRWRMFLKENWFTLLFVLTLAGAYIVLRTPGDTFTSMEMLQTALSTGNPTVVEFYSNQCSICLISKPKVDQLERDLMGQAALLRLSVKDEVGRAQALQWGVRGVPAFFVLDGTGEIVYAQAGAPDIAAIKAAVAKAQ
jgi:protein-disulfide isomerase